MSVGTDKRFKNKHATANYTLVIDTDMQFKS